MRFDEEYTRSISSEPGVRVRRESLVELVVAPWQAEAPCQQRIALGAGGPVEPQLAVVVPGDNGGAGGPVKPPPATIVPAMMAAMVALSCHN